METVLQTLLDHDQIAIIGGFYCLHCLPGLGAVLVGLSQELNNVNHFSIRGDVMPGVLARRLIARQKRYSGAWPGHARMPEYRWMLNKRWCSSPLLLAIPKLVDSS